MFAIQQRLTLTKWTYLAVTAILAVAMCLAYADSARAEGETETAGDGAAESAPEGSSPPVVAVSEVRPDTRTLTVGTDADVRLAVDLIGSQGVSVTQDIDVTWSAESGALSDSTGRLNTLRAPTVPGVYTVTAQIDADHCEDARDCIATFSVVVQTSAVRNAAGVEVAVPVNPSGAIPEVLTDGSGFTYAVATPVEGMASRGAGWSVTVPPGAVADGTYLGFHLADIGIASNAGQTHHRYTLSGTQFRLTALASDVTAPSRIALGEPATVCVPLPTALISRLSDVALTASIDDASLTVLGTELNRADDGYVVCGKVSELPADLAVGVRGAPTALTNTDIDVEVAVPQVLPVTGATTIDTGAAWLALAAGIALVLVALGSKAALRLQRDRRVGMTARR